MKIDKLYDKLSSREQYRLTDRSNLLMPKFPRSLFAFENRFLTVTREISRLVSESKSAITLLDIGCGDGVYEKLLPKDVLAKTKIIGVDFSIEQLKKASKYLDETHRVDLDSEKLPFKNGSIDLVICSEVLEHLFFPEKILAEIYRVLKSDGILILTVPNFSSLQTRVSLFLTGMAPMVNYSTNKEHIRFYSLKDIDILLGNKFTKQKVRGIGSALFAHWNSAIKLPLPRIFQIIGDKFLPKLANGLLLIVTKK
jgi:ubiquinone/menaquinone biosynthesis C-methylase UbiE